MPGVKKAILAPSGVSMDLERNADTLTFRIPEFSCHQMIEFQA